MNLLDMLVKKMVHAPYGIVKCSSVALDAKANGRITMAFQCKGRQTFIESHQAIINSLMKPYTLFDVECEGEIIIVKNRDVLDRCFGKARREDGVLFVELIVECTSARKITSLESAIQSVYKGVA